MRLLLDTHAVIWAVEQPSKLSVGAAAALQDSANELLLSAGSIWEISIKIGLAKLSLSLPYRQWIVQAMTDLGANLLPITVEYASVLTNLPKHHGDPFDRLLIAQAMVEGVPVVSGDPAFDA